MLTMAPALCHSPIQGTSALQKNNLRASGKRGSCNCYLIHKVVCYFDWRTAKIAEIGVPRVHPAPCGPSISRDPGSVHHTNQNLIFIW